MAVTDRPSQIPRAQDGRKGRRRHCSVCHQPKLAGDLAKDHRHSGLIDPPICLKCRQEQREAEQAARAVEIDARHPPRTCNVCGQEKPASQLVRYAPNKGGGPSPFCLDCSRASKRRSEAGVDLGWQAVREAPDRSPVEHLCDELANDRREGVDFDEAWPDAVEFVLSCLPRGLIAGWRQVFGETQAAWRAGYERRPLARVPLTPDLLDDDLAA